MSDDGGAWVFGYGSLVCRPSLATYLGREPVGGRDWSVARLGGFRRLWNTAMDNGTAERYAHQIVMGDLASFDGLKLRHNSERLADAVMATLGQHALQHQNARR